MERELLEVELGRISWNQEDFSLNNETSERKYFLMRVREAVFHIQTSKNRNLWGLDDEGGGSIREQRECPRVWAHCRGLEGASKERDLTSCKN